MSDNCLLCSDPFHPQHQHIDTSPAHVPRHGRSVAYGQKDSPLLAPGLERDIHTIVAFFLCAECIFYFIGDQHGLEIPASARPGSPGGFRDLQYIQRFCTDVWRPVYCPRGLDYYTLFYCRCSLRDHGGGQACKCQSGFCNCPCFRGTQPETAPGLTCSNYCPAPCTAFWTGFHRSSLRKTACSAVYRFRFCRRHAAI